MFQAPAGTSKESNPDKIEVHGPGIEPEGVLGEFDPTFNVKTQGAGPGRLGVNIRGPKGLETMNKMIKVSRAHRNHYDAILPSILFSLIYNQHYWSVTDVFRFFSF